MKVKELINQLKNVNQESEIIVSDIFYSIFSTLAILEIANSTNFCYLKTKLQNLLTKKYNEGFSNGIKREQELESLRKKAEKLGVKIVEEEK